MKMACCNNPESLAAKTQQQNLRWTGYPDLNNKQRRGEDTKHETHKTILIIIPVIHTQM